MRRETLGKLFIGVGGAGILVALSDILLGTHIFEAGYTAISGHAPDKDMLTLKGHNYRVLAFTLVTACGVLLLLPRSDASK